MESLASLTALLQSIHQILWLLTRITKICVLLSVNSCTTYIHAKRHRNLMKYCMAQNFDRG